MAIRWKGEYGLVALGLSGLIGVAVPGNSPAQVTARPPCQPGAHPLDRALQATLSTGRPTVAVLTSWSSPDSNRFWVNLANAPEVQDLIRGGRLVQMAIESNPRYAQAIGVKTTPRVVVYRKGS